jgi:peptidoglycan/LPS O-acetylase OafA/YrhL
MPDKPFRLSYRPAFDGMRGLAILLVILHHTNLKIFQGGFIGVDVFFVLSGFLITALLIQEYDKHGRISIKHFYIRRALRLLPALVVMLIALNVYVSWQYPGQIGSTATDSLVTLFYAANWVYTTGHASLYLTHTWSLAIEEQFYLLFPLLMLFLLRRVSRRYVTVIIAGLCVLSFLWGLMALVSGVSWIRVYYGLDTRLWELLAGCALALVLASPVYGGLKTFAGNHPHIVMRAAMASGMTLVALTVGIDGKYPLSSYAALLLATLAAVAMVLSLVTGEHSAFNRLLSAPPLVFMGRISYALYLWHVPIFIFVGYQAIGPLMLSTAFTFGAAMLSYRLIEQPFLRLKERFQGNANRA